MTEKLKTEGQAVLAALRERAEHFGVVDLRSAFINAEDYPEFDADTGANYSIGWLNGCAETLGISVFDLMKKLEE